MQLTPTPGSHARRGTWMPVLVCAVAAAATGRPFALPQQSPGAPHAPDASRAGGAAATSATSAFTEQPVERVAFGSCFKTRGPAHVWDAIDAWNPDVLLLLGDNVYADTLDMDVMRAKYAELDALEGFRRLRERATLLVTWDDHDYGLNDAGAEHPRRDAAQAAFLDFCREPEGSTRRATPGVYTARTLGPPGRRVQVILLDTRYFRGPLQRRATRLDAAFGRPGRYRPSEKSEQTMLGEAQWAWLAQRLQEPAEVRLLVSSIQVVAEDHGYEAWVNLPRERARLLELIRRTAARGVLILSGDRHRAELSVLDPRRATPGSAVDVGYPIHDLTSSSLNAPFDWRNEVNRHRLGSAYCGANFGTLAIDWDAADPLLELRVHADDGRVVLRHDVRLSELQP